MFECQKVWEGQEDMKNDKKELDGQQTQWLIQHWQKSKLHPAAEKLNRFRETIGKFWTENLGKRKILAKMVSGICLMTETAAALFLFWLLLVFYQRKQLSGWS